MGIHMPSPAKRKAGKMTNKVSNKFLRFIIKDIDGAKIGISALLPIPKIEETHHAAKQLAIPFLFQFEVDVAGAATEYVDLVEEIVRPPFVHLRLDIALADRHLGIDRLAHLGQIVTHGLLARDETGVHDMGILRCRFCVGEVHAQFVFGPLALILLGLGCSTVVNTWRWVSIKVKAKAAPNTSEIVIEAHTPVRPDPPALIKMGGMR